MKQMVRNVTMEGYGILRDSRYLLHDRDTKYTKSFRAIIASGQVEPLMLPARSPHLNAFAERWIRSVKEECLSKVILLGERSLRRALSEFVEHHHASAIIRERAMSSCSLVIRISATCRGLSNAEAIGWVPALLPSRGSVIARPRFNAGTPNSARCNWEIEEVVEAALLPVVLYDAVVLEGQASPSVTLLQVPPAGASAGMRIGVLSQYSPRSQAFAFLSCQELALGYLRQYAPQWLPCLLLAFAALAVSGGGGRGHEGERQQAGYEISHG